EGEHGRHRAASVMRSEQHPTPHRPQVKHTMAGDTWAMNSPADELQIDRRAPIERISLAPTSWVDFVPRFVRDADAVFNELHSALSWQQTEVLRYDKYVAERRLGVGVRNEAYPVMRQTDLHLRARFQVPFTGVAAILYRDGQDFQGLHSDREL